MSPVEAYRKRREDKKNKSIEKELDALKSKHRKPAEIQADYNKITSEVGQKQYHAEVLKQEISQMNKSLFNLNQEFAMANKVWQEISEKEKALNTPEETTTEVIEGEFDEDEKSNDQTA